MVKEIQITATPAEEKTYFETTDDGQVRSHFVNN